MTDLDRFERRVALTLIAEADEALPGFDPATVSRTAITGGRRRPIRSGWGLVLTRNGGLAAAALAGLVIAGMLLVPGLRQPPVGSPSSSPLSPSPTTPGPIGSPEGTWTSVPGTAEARGSEVVAIVLLDGRVLVVAGTDDLRFSELYDPAAGTWTVTGRTAQPRLHPSITLLGDGRVLLAGGLDGRYAPSGGSAVSPPPALDSAELYDPATGSWSQTRAMTVARSAHSATLLPDGRVLVAGGAARTSADSRFSSTEIYDPSSGTWTAGVPMLQPRDEHTATLLQNGLVLVAGGQRTNRLRSTELYDPVAGTWTAAADLPEAFLFHRAVALPNGLVLIVGGDVPRGPGAAGSSHAAMFDPVAGTWTLAADMIVPRLGHQATGLGDGDVLVTGGGPDGEPTTTAERFDVETGTWTAVTRMLAARSGHAAVLLADGHVLVVGGLTDDGLAPTPAELFTR